MYKSILIRNGRLFDGNAFYPGDVLVENGRIAQLDWGANPYDFRENPENTVSGQEGYRCRLTLCQGKTVYRSI